MAEFFLPRNLAGERLVIPIRNTGQSNLGFEQQERRHPIRKVTLEGKDFNVELLDDFVVDLEVEEVTNGLAYANVWLHNRDSSWLTNERLFDPQNIIRIWTGYHGLTLEYRGQFRIHEPDYKFLDTAQLICLKCVSEEFDLMHTERQVSYSQKSDSEIAREIAIRNNLRFDIENSVTVNRKVIQASMSDAEFLESRAKLYGFDFYVRDSVLHFHRPRYEHSGIVLLYDAGEESHIKEFNVRLSTWYRGVEVEVSKIDPFNKEQYNVTSDENVLDPLQQRLAQRNQNVIPISQMSTIKGEQPKRYLINQGQWQTREEAQRQVQTYSEHTRYGVEACGKVDLGLEKLHARQVMSVLGIGKFSGDYYVTRVVHRYKDTYKVSFEVVKVGPSDLASRPLTDSVRGPNVKAQADAVPIQSSGTFLSS